MRITHEDWLQAQNSVLGAALIDNKAAAIVLTETEETDYTGPCRTVFSTMKKIYAQGKPIDPVIVVSDLGAEYRSFVLDLMEATPSCANVDYYIQLCREQARVLSLREIGRQLSEVESSQQASDLLSQANGQMISKQKFRSVTMAEMLRNFMDNYSKKPDYLEWPFSGFRNHLRVRPGRFILIGAEPSVGKTAFALQCGLKWSEQKKVGFFSLETDEETVTERVLAHKIQLSLSQIMERTLSDDEHSKLAIDSSRMAQTNFEFIPASGMTTSDLRAKIQERRYDIVLIDYLQLMHAKGSSRYEEVTNISLDLHTIAQTLGVTVVALSQLSRSSDDHTPRNSDLRESGQLEQDADVIMMMKLAKQAEPSGSRKLFVTKNKEGELFMTQLIFDGKHQTFFKEARTGEVMSKLQADGKKNRTQNRMAAMAEQMTILPQSTAVPFEQ